MTEKTGAVRRVVVRTGGAMSSAGLRSRSGISFDFLERLLASAPKSAGAFTCRHLGPI